MTVIYKRWGKVGSVCGFAANLHYLPPYNSLIVISNEVRNLNLTCIEKILPDNSGQKYESANFLFPQKGNPFIGSLFVK